MAFDGRLSPGTPLTSVQHPIFITMLSGNPTTLLNLPLYYCPGFLLCFGCSGVVAARCLAVANQPLRRRGNSPAIAPITSGLRATTRQLGESAAFRQLTTLSGRILHLVGHAFSGTALIYRNSRLWLPGTVDILPVLKDGACRALGQPATAEAACSLLSSSHFSKAAGECTMASAPQSAGLASCSRKP